MVSCIILVGSKKWCENNEKIIQDKGESWLIYDRLPINALDKKHLRLFIENGDFITCICIPKQLGGNRNVEYIAYTPKNIGNIGKIGKNVIELTRSGEYYLDEKLIKNEIHTSRKEINIPIKPPEPCPSWEDYDFVNVKIKDKIEKVPRPYTIAINISNIKAIEIPLSEFKNIKNEGYIHEGQLQKSFIIAHTNNKFIEEFRKINRKLLKK